MVRVTSPQYILIEYGMVRENKKRRKYHYTQIFFEVFFFFDLLISGLSSRVSVN